MAMTTTAATAAAAAATGIGSHQPTALFELALNSVAKRFPLDLQVGTANIDTLPIPEGFKVFLRGRLEVLCAEALCDVYFDDESAKVWQCPDFHYHAIIKIWRLIPCSKCRRERLARQLEK